MTVEDSYSTAFLASLPIAAQLSPAKNTREIVAEANRMALEAVAHWQEQVSDLHRSPAAEK